jgi:GntR family transcriptional regulator
MYMLTVSAAETRKDLSKKERFMSSSSSKKLNRYDATPLYAQLHDIIRAKISSGEWAPDSMIPSENELGRIYGVSRMTIRNLITQFVNEGILYRIQGKGTFVSAPKLEISGLHYTGIRSQLEEMGHSVTTKLLSNEKISADEALAGKLQIAAGDEVYAIGFRKNDVELRDKVNEALKALAEDGTMDKIGQGYPDIYDSLSMIKKS